MPEDKVPAAVPVTADHPAAQAPSQMPSTPAVNPSWVPLPLVPFSPMLPGSTAGTPPEVGSPIQLTLPSMTDPPVPPPPVSEPAPQAALTPNPVDGMIAGVPPPPPDMALPNGPLEPPPADPLPAPAAPPKLSRITSEAKPALEVLQKFLKAANWTERVTYSRQGDRLKQAMQTHAAKYGDGPIYPANITFVDRRSNKSDAAPYNMFELEGGTLRHPILVLVEQPSKGPPTVDWELFAEFKEDLLLKFLENNGAAPQTFRVMMRRKHYFDKDVADISSKEGFALTQPGASFEGHVFVPKGTAIARDIEQKLPWGSELPIIVELIWRSSNNSRWVEINSIKSFGWRMDHSKSSGRS